MKKFIIFLLVTIVVLISVLFFKLFSTQSGYHKTLAASDSSVLVLDNFNLGQIKIITADTNEISFDLQGDPDVLANLEYENEGLFTKFGLSEDWSGVTGTITVPKGVLLDISLSDEAMLKIDDSDLSSTDSFLVDTSGLSSLEVGTQGNLLLNSSGDLTLWDDEEWVSLGDSDDNNEGDSDESNDSNDADEPIYCGVGSQAIRDYCCVNENADTNTPACDGIEHWIFDNVARDCDFTCEATDLGEVETEVSDCSVGGQSERNACCSRQHVGEYQGCIGSWEYSSAAKACAFDCDDSGDNVVNPVADPGEGEGEGEQFDDPVSNYCSIINSETDRDLCCNDSLKNELSTGPRAGFPDCIGTWSFDGEMGCEFECAERAEMINILNELKQKAQN